MPSLESGTPLRSDFNVVADGSLIGFAPVSKPAIDHAFLYAEQEPCSWLGRAFYVPSAQAEQVLFSLIRSGFTIHVPLDLGPTLGINTN